MNFSAVTRGLLTAVLLSMGLVLVSSNAMAADTIVFSENFDSLPLFDSTSTTEENWTQVWTSIPPTGWAVDANSVNGGVPEFKGWTFVDAVWWNATAGQNRELFQNVANGTVAVADGDEWDDGYGASGRMRPLLYTPDINLSSLGGDQATICFNSSWRTEPQQAWLHVSYDGGQTYNQLFYWHGDNDQWPQENYKPTEYAETVIIPLDSGANSAKFKFEYEAGNNWWWAIDNVQVGSWAMKAVETDGYTYVEETAGGTSDVIKIVLLQDPGAHSVTVTVDSGMSDDVILSGAGTGDNYERSIVLTSADLGVVNEIVVTAYDDTEVEETEEIVDINLTVTSGNAAFDGYEIEPVQVTVRTDDMPGISLDLETFDDVTLLPAVDERNTTDKLNVWTDIPPAGWFVDDSGVPGAGDPGSDGVTEWAGWSFADLDFWIQADYQDRELFTKASGNVAVADCDEWDDSPHDDGYYNAYMTTKVYPLVNVDPNSAWLFFDSSWRPEHDSYYHQSANIFADFSTRSVELMNWVSDGDHPDYHPYAVNETVFFDLQNQPADKFVRFTFGLYEAGNDWWWAIDNLIFRGDANPVGDKLSITGTKEMHLFEDSQLAMDSASFDVVLTNAPTDTVTVTVDPNGILGQATVSSQNGNMVGDALELTFTTSDWDQPQTVTVTVIDDSDSEDRFSNPIVFGTDSTDPDFASGYVSDYVMVTIYDNERADLVVFQTGIDTFVSEHGDTDTYVVAVSKEPSSDVTVNCVDNFSQVQLDPATFALTSTDWMPKTVTVSAVDDVSVENDPHITTVINTVSGGGYNDEMPLTVRIVENDCGSWGFLRGDINQDCKVNIEDLVEVVDDWVECTFPDSSDCDDVR